jgi:hypothetical protein
MATSNDLLSFKEWYSKNPSIPYNNRVDKYNVYLKGVLVDQVVVADAKQLNTVSDSYKAFLSKLINIYDDDPEVIALVDMDLDDPHQLALAIPVFARKIRDIAKFYNKKRRTLGDLKIELSLKGTPQGVDKAITDLFYNNYSTDENYKDPTSEGMGVTTDLPKRSELVNNMNIVVIEKYNTTSQHPKSNN